MAAKSPVNGTFTGDSRVTLKFLLAVVAIIVVPVGGSFLHLNSEVAKFQGQLETLTAALEHECERAKEIDDKLDERYMSKGAGEAMQRSADSIEKYLREGR